MNAVSAPTAAANQAPVSETEILLQLVADLSTNVAELARELADSSESGLYAGRFQVLHNRINAVGGIARHHLVSRVGSKGLERVAEVTRAGGLAD